MAALPHIIQVPALVGGWLDHPVALPNAVHKEGRMFQPFHRSSETSQRLLLGDGKWAAHKGRAFSGSEVWNLLVQKRQDWIDNYYDSRDSSEKVGLNAEEEALEGATLLKQKRRMKRRRSVRAALELSLIHI